MKRSTPMDRNIGAKVKFYRERMGLTQKELAARLQVNGCDLSETIVGHIETGHRAVSVFEIDKLAEVLQVDYSRRDSLRNRTSKRIGYHGEALMKRSTPMDRNIGAKVRHYRRERGLTQKELAAQLQVDGCDLSELAEVLRVDYNALFAQD